MALAHPSASIRRAAALLSGLLAGCSAPPPPLPLAMAPRRAIALEHPLTPETIAVLDFVDERPDFERGAAEIEEVAIGGDWWSRDRFWTFHPSGGSLAVDPAVPPDLRARVTGSGAFAWYPFPNPGIGKPRVVAPALGVADYVALELEQRGLFTRVVRCRDEEQARAAGATWLLAGRLARCGAMLAEARDPFVVRPDDWTEYRLVAAAHCFVTLRRTDEEAPVLERECLGRDEETHLHDALTAYRGAHWRPLYQLDATRFPDFARADLGHHARRALEQATASLVPAIEQRLLEALAPAPAPAEAVGPPAAPPPGDS